MLDPTEWGCGSLGIGICGAEKVAFGLTTPAHRYEYFLLSQASRPHRATAALVDEFDAGSYRRSVWVRSAKLMINPGSIAYEEYSPYTSQPIFLV